MTGVSFKTVKYLSLQVAGVTVVLIGMGALSALTRNAVVGLAATTEPVGGPPHSTDFSPPGFDGPPPFGPGGPERFGPGGMRETKLVSRFDKDNKGWLNTTEGKAAREYLRERYFGYVRDLAGRWLDWNKLGPVAQQYHNLIAEYVASDTKKLYSQQAFENCVSEDINKFADERREFLLSRPKP